MAKKSASEQVKPGGSTVPAIAPETIADQDDSGWSTDSATDKEAFAPAPSDTTVKPAKTAGTASPAKPVESPRPATQLPAGDIEDPADGDEPPDPAAAKQTRGQHRLTDRASSLTKEIATLTYTKHQTDREVQQGRTELARLRGELADVNRKLGKPAADGAVAPREPERGKPVDIGPMPQHPKYTDFETDAEYNAAVTEWQTKMTGWQTQREGALRQSISSDVDQRLEARDRSREAQDADQAYYDRLGELKNQHKNWDTVIESLRDIRSSWHQTNDPKAAPAPFLSDVTRYAEDGPAVLWWMANNPEAAQVLADLQPTRPLRDGIIHAPSALSLFEYFATDEGRKEWNTLTQMHPMRVPIALGALSARLAASSGPATEAPESITLAEPSAKPPVGAPRARSEPKGHQPPSGTFEDWNAAEDHKDLVAAQKAAGIPVSV